MDAVSGFLLEFAEELHGGGFIHRCAAHDFLDEGAFANQRDEVLHGVMFRVGAAHQLTVSGPGGTAENDSLHEVDGRMQTDDIILCTNVKHLTEGNAVGEILVVCKECRDRYFRDLGCGELIDSCGRQRVYHPHHSVVQPFQSPLWNQNAAVKEFVRFKGEEDMAVLGFRSRRNTCAELLYKVFRGIDATYRDELDRNGLTIDGYGRIVAVCVVGTLLRRPVKHSNVAGSKSDFSVEKSITVIKPLRLVRVDVCGYDSVPDYIHQTQ